MTVAANLNKVSFAGDDATTVFDLGGSFIFFNASELKVYIVVDSTGVQTLQTITTDYTVSGGAGATGSVTMVTAPAIGETLLVLREMPLTQGSDLVNNDTQDAEVVEDALDKLTLADQQLDEAIARALVVPSAETAGFELPAAVDRRNKLLGFTDTAAATPVALDAVSLNLYTVNDALDAINALTPAADKLPYYTGAAAAALATLTSFGRSLIAAASAVAARIVLGITTAANASTVLEAGTTGQRDGSPVAGYIRFNTTNTEFEGYNGTSWGSIGGGAAGGPNNPVFYENDTNVTVNYTITSGKNAMSAGPITIDSGITVTVPSGSAWTIVGV